MTREDVIHWFDRPDYRTRPEMRAAVMALLYGASARTARRIYLKAKASQWK